MNAHLASELSHHFKGLKRLTAKTIGEGLGRVKIGKDPLPFGLYKFLGKAFLSQSSREYVFGHTFMIICWNLMCRSANAFLIKYNHIEWNEDSLCIYFAHMKNDQCGERPRDPRHVYANPLNPEICPVLSLGIYWITFSFGKSENALFPGKNQYDRFRKIMNRSTNIEDIKNELIRRGIDPKDLGTHSIRKGSATYCSSGSTAGPSSSSIHLRAGWAMGGVQDTYIRYEAAGDMYVGRVASGLPLEKPEFAIVGPYFVQSANVSQYIEAIFNNIPATLFEVAENVLASLVYHSNFLITTIPQDHPALQSILFRDFTLLDTLKPLVKCGVLGDNGNHKVATGIPPHTSLLKEMKIVCEEIKQVLPAIDTITERTVNGINKLLEDKAIGAGSVTREGLKEILRDEFSKYMAADIWQRKNEVNATEVSQQTQQLQLFTWGGRINRLPEDYNLPSGTVQSAFLIWMTPDSSKGICALRYCSAIDFSTKEKKRRFGDLSKLMKMIEEYAKLKDIWPDNPDIAHVNHMTNTWWENINISSCTPQGRTRRLGQMKWTSVLKLLRLSGQI
jgi:hypothetical protein